MAHRDVIVVGASSGGVEVLRKLVAGLPEDLAAAVFIVLHVAPDVPSHLPNILNRAGRMPAAHAVDQEHVRRGRIYIAPPGLQMYVQRGRIAVRRGPQENDHRPSIDVLFRTAAHFYGRRVIGVVLTGALDDGSAGLRAIKQAGGTAIVQDPRDAMFPDMPTNALQAVDADFVLPSRDLAPMLVELVATDVDTDSLQAEVPLETVEERVAPDEALRSDQLGPPSNFVCPTCNGTLYEIDEGSTIRFRCRVGHAYSANTMESAQNGSVEKALWTALRALEERSALLKKLSEYARRRGHDAIARMYEQRSEQIEGEVRTVHDLITGSNALDPVEQGGL